MNAQRAKPSPEGRVAARLRAPDTDGKHRA